MRDAGPIDHKFVIAVILLLLSLSACANDQGAARSDTLAVPAPPAAPIAGSGSAGAVGATAGVSGVTAVPVTQIGPPIAGAPAPVAAPNPVSPTSATPSMMAGTGAAGSGADEVTGPAGAAGDGGHAHANDHCADGYLPEPSDETMMDGPAEFYPPGNMDPNIVDTTVQPEVLKWMQDNLWEAAHVEWHAIRGCNVPGGRGLSKVNICNYTQLIPKDQNCQTAGDGYQFLVFHRHMIQALKQLWPKHTEQFTGFAKFPTSAADVPPQWRSAWKDWDPQILEAGKIGDEIDKPENMARFSDEGVLGFWLQCNVGQKLASPPSDMPFVGLHFVLHAKWARPGNTQHGVNNTSANVDNYMFWKLHGWIDSIWERYRVAKGLAPDEPKLRVALAQQCHEMHALGQVIDPTPPADDEEPLPVERGLFHETVRPIFEQYCSACHSESSPQAGMSLGGHISSADVVANLVNRPTMDGGQFLRIVPGSPEQSWLYLKVSGMAADAGCMGAACNPQTMPPTGQVTLSAEQLAAIRNWIEQGAPVPELTL